MTSFSYPEMKQSSLSTRDDGDDVLSVADTEWSNNGRKSEYEREKGERVLDAVPLQQVSKDSASRHARADFAVEPRDIDARETKRVLQQSPGRKRKESLRKAAMAKLGSSSRHELVSTPTITTTVTTPSPEETNASFFDPATSVNNDTFTIGPQERLQSQGLDYQQATTSRAKAPYPSTTDEEETSFDRPPTSISSSSLEEPNHTKAMPLLQRRSHRSVPQVFPPDKLLPDELDIEDDWDYRETEWWGWVILLATWIVFVVVMGSCFGVWSWAWDVGETPYAPPDLEDDDTLPITGYYPALMVCTAVMSWVWVTCAWVGMQYFRYSKR